MVNRLHPGLHRARLALRGFVRREDARTAALLGALPDLLRTRPEGWSGDWAGDWPEADHTHIGFDVGAGSGLATRALHRVCRQVYAFEPEPRAASALARCGFPGVEVIEAAASWKAGEARLSRSGPGGGTLETLPGAASSAPCRTATLDSLLPEAETRHPGFAALVRIDAAGHEGAVLTGAERLVDRAHACLVIRIDPARNRRHAGVIGWLASRGYAPFLPGGAGLRPLGPEKLRAPADIVFLRQAG